MQPSHATVKLLTEALYLCDTTRQTVQFSGWAELALFRPPAIDASLFYKRFKICVFKKVGIERGLPRITHRFIRVRELRLQLGVQS